MSIPILVFGLMLFTISSSVVLTLSFLYPKFLDMKYRIEELEKSRITKKDVEHIVQFPPRY